MPPTAEAPAPASRVLAPCCAASRQGRAIFLCEGCGRLVVAVTPTPTQLAFIRSPQRIVWLVGPSGEGKTFAGVLAMLHHAATTQGRLHPLTGVPLPARWALVRDTHQTLKRVTVPAMDQTFPGVFTWRDDAHVATTHGLTLDLLGVDSPGDLAKLQGAEYDGIWLEEPAPLTANGPHGPVVNQGMPAEVFKVAAQRIRGGGRGKRLQITMNPADRSHWTYYERELHGVWADCSAVCRIRPGENPHLTAQDRDHLRRAYQDRPDLYKRYVLGQESEVYAGLAITPEYNPEWHKYPTALTPLFGAESFLMFDGGLNPTCVVAQLTPSGRFHLLDVVMLPNAGMAQLLKHKVVPLLQSPRWRAIKRFRALGDASLKNREQSNSELSAAWEIERELRPWLPDGYEGGVQDWTLRREALHTLLESNLGGAAKLLVNPVCTPGEPWHRIHAALAGGYCYKVSGGVVQRDGPEKNVHSHVGDAISHAVARLFGVLPAPEVREPEPRRRQARATSYAVGGVYTPLW